MICRTLQIGRATAYRQDRPRPRRYRRQEDEVVLAQLRQMLRERASYGYRRARRIVNRAFGAGYNRKRIQRVMRLCPATPSLPRLGDTLSSAPILQ